MEDEDFPLKPKLIRQKAQRVYFFERRYENLSLFIDCFFNKRSVTWPNLYYFPLKEQRDFIIDSRNILKRFFVLIYHRKLKRQYTSFYLLGFYLPSSLCGLIINYFYSI